MYIEDIIKILKEKHKNQALFYYRDTMFYTDDQFKDYCQIDPLPFLRKEDFELTENMTSISTHVYRGIYVQYFRVFTKEEYELVKNLPE